MDTQDDQPERPPPPGDGTAVVPGWYPDPGGGWGLRWWDGVRWTEHVAGAPPPTVKWTPSWTWSLSNVFQVELALTSLGLLFAWLTPMSSAGCTSDRCYDLFGSIWLRLVVVHVLLGAVCGVAFWWSKWIWVKRAAALILPIGLVTTWVVADRMLTKALNM